MLLEVVLRCWDGGNVHNYLPRITGAKTPKSEVLKRCTRSIVAALKGIDHRLNLLVHPGCQPETHAFLNALPARVIAATPGNNPSWLEAIDLCARADARYSYQVEDDYLHAPESVREMLAFLELAKEKGVPNACIHPYDDADNYKGQFMEAGMIFPGRDRHWRTNTYSTAVCLAEPWVFRQPEWNRLAKLYETPEGKTPVVIHEGNTINHIWKSGRATLCTPLPSLAVALNENEPPLFDWRHWWEYYA